MPLDCGALWYYLLGCRLDAEGSYLIAVSPLPRPRDHLAGDVSNLLLECEQFSPSPGLFPRGDGKVDHIISVGTPSSMEGKPYGVIVLGPDDVLCNCPGAVDCAACKV